MLQAFSGIFFKVHHKFRQNRNYEFFANLVLILPWIFMISIFSIADRHKLICARLFISRRYRENEMPQKLYLHERGGGGVESL